MRILRLCVVTVLPAGGSIGTMLHPDTYVQFIDPLIGSGVFAGRLIPRGTIVWVQDRFDRVYTETEVRQLEPVYQEILERYCFRNRRGEWIFCWDLTRYINHSFNANCIATPYGCELAIRDIPAGEQLTNDYGFFNIIEPFDCLPEAGASRTRVMPDDLLRCASEWDAKLAAAYPELLQREQPLITLLSEENRARLEAVSRGEQTPLSIQAIYCPIPAGAEVCCA